MSKSLKNFITIQQALKEHSARQLRLMFLMQPWDRPMNFSDQTVGAAKAKEHEFKNFFGTIKALLRTKWVDEEVGWRNKDEDFKLSKIVMDTQTKVHDGFCDNFNTPAVINALSELVTYCNSYLTRVGGKPAVYMLQKAAIYTTQILKVVGVCEGSDEIGFPVSAAGSESEVEAPLNALTELRDTVRSIARKKGSIDEIVSACDAVAAKTLSAGPPPARLGEQVAKVLADFVSLIRKEAKAGHGALLSACDFVRDEALTEIGVKLEDGDGNTVWKLEDAETLKKEVAEKRAKAAEAQAAAAAKQVAKVQKELEKLSAAAKPALEAMADEIAKAALTVADLEAWSAMQAPVQKEKGKPSPEFIAASKAATEKQAPFLEELVTRTGEANKAIKKKLDNLLKKKNTLDQDREEYLKKGGEEYLKKLREQIAAAR